MLICIHIPVGMGTLCLPGQMHVCASFGPFTTGNIAAKECCDSVTDTGYELVCLIIYYQQFLNINIIAHLCSFLLITAHYCSLLLIIAHYCSFMLIFAHSLLIIAHLCSFLLIHCSLSILTLKTLRYLEISYIHPRIVTQASKAGSLLLFGVHYCSFSTPYQF